MEYTLKDGRVIPLKRIATRHVERIRAKHVFPDPPTYSFETAGGVVLTYQHDETSIETPEEHKAWNEYQAQYSRVLGRQQLEIAQFLICHCIDMDPPPVEEWSVNFDRWGLEPPDDTDPIAYKCEWYDCELTVDPDDAAGLLSRLWQMGGLLEEAQIGEFERFFRSTVARLPFAGTYRPPRGSAKPGPRGKSAVGEGPGRVGAERKPA